MSKCQHGKMSWECPECEIFKCTFCGMKYNKDICFIAAPDNTCICESCVESARDIIGAYRRNNMELDDNDAVDIG